MFLDYRLPTTTGDEIASTLDPSIPCILISGDLDIQPKHPFKKVFTKPYSVDEMRMFIDSVAGSEDE